MWRAGAPHAQCAAGGCVYLFCHGTCCGWGAVCADCASSWLLRVYSKKYRRVPARTGRSTPHSPRQHRESSVEYEFERASSASSSRPIASNDSDRRDLLPTPDHPGPAPWSLVLPASRCRSCSCLLGRLTRDGHFSPTEYSTREPVRETVTDRARDRARA